MTTFMTAKEINKRIRAELKALYPGVKFSVRKSKSGNSVAIRWVDGPREAVVQEWASQWNGTHFDGMDDSRTTIRHTWNGQPATFEHDFVFCYRTYSPEAELRALRAIAQANGIPVPEVTVNSRGSAEYDSFPEGWRDAFGGEYAQYLVRQWLESPDRDQESGQALPIDEDAPVFDEATLMEGAPEVPANAVEMVEAFADDDLDRAAELQQQRRDAYEARREYREEKYSRLAEKARRESEQRYEASRQVVEMIPAGQPILVGHHSERSHRAAIKRSNNNMRKSIDAAKKAEYYSERLDAAQKNRAISSDDPDALEKLRAKLADLEESRAYNREINKLVRKAIKYSADKGEQIDKLVELADHLDRATAANLLTPDFCGRVGVPDYQFSNMGGEIRRLRQRIEQIEAREAEYQDGETETLETLSDINLAIIRDRVANRIRLHFPGKPDSDTRARLKVGGFRWSRQHLAWQRQLNANGELAAETMVRWLRERG